MRPAIASILAVLAVTACTTEGSSSADRTASSRHCFWGNRVNSFQAQDDRTVHVRVGVNEIYRLTLFAPCNEVNWSNRITLVNRGGSSRICDGNTAEIVTSNVRGRQRCSISEVHLLTPEEVAALPPRARP